LSTILGVRNFYKVWTKIGFGFGLKFRGMAINEAIVQKGPSLSKCAIK